MNDLDRIPKDLMKKILINAQNISYEVENNSILEDVSVSLGGNEQIGLVGPNGSGKSTLMKIMAGIIRPTKGEIIRSGRNYYVPQLDLPLFKSDMSILEYLSAIHEEWWDITDLLERKFGLRDVNIEQTLATLSGGELIKLHLAIALTLNPDVLFLDEPTNHLDLPSIEMLIEFLHEYDGAFIVVSHDPFFLDQVTSTTWEIEGKKVNRFGGNYTNYREQKAAMLEGRARQHETAKKELEKTKKAIQREQERAGKSRRTGKALKGDRSMSAVEKGFFKNKASATAGKNKVKLEESEADATERIKATKATHRRKAHVTLETESGSKGRTLSRTRNFNVSLQDGRKLVENAEITISYGDRIVLTGRNGAGKTMFTKALLGDTSALSVEGDNYLAPDSRIVYLSQKYEIVDPELSLVENMEKINTDLSYEQIRKLLGNFLFFNEEDIRKKAKVLSGGEVARLAFAMITASPVDLLVLDEPTNNLDIDTVDSIVDALEDFPGAIVVISHNIDFLSRIGVDQAYVINSKKIKRLGAIPEDEDEFYDELMSELEA